MPSRRRDVRLDMPADTFEPVAEQLLLILCHLFERLPLHAGSVRAAATYRASPSKAMPRLQHRT